MDGRPATNVVVLPFVIFDAVAISRTGTFSSLVQSMLSRLSTIILESLYPNNADAISFLSLDVADIFDTFSDINEDNDCDLFILKLKSIIIIIIVRKYILE